MLEAVNMNVFYLLILCCLCVSLDAKPVEQDTKAIYPLLGGAEDADVNAEDVKSAAKFALAEVDKLSNSAYKQTLVKVLSAKKQVVSGILYHLELEIGDSNCHKANTDAASECTLREGSNIQICSVKVSERAWLNERIVSNLSCAPKSRQKRKVTDKSTISGGLADADVNANEVKSAAAFALAQVEERSNSIYKQLLVKVLSAKKQVVAGTLYHLQLEVGESNCNKADNDAAAECTLREGSKNQICNVKVWDRPWLSKREVTEIQCTEKSDKKKRSAQDEVIVGGLSDADVNDANVKSAANFALTEMNSQENSAYKHILVQIRKAKTQVVAGSLYHLELELGESNCTRESTDAASCSLKEKSNNKICNVQVWDRPWLNKREVTKVNCSPKTESQK